ncbi:hypothetical protein JZ751_006362 [Albula glossodonta]|uniref:SH3 domain-containing protein n=1 Tax=Albula glossodonta TaxID=121402 RepID=A0A8T2NB09_9TELE|nr:hypothetical protein JZ751_006362 [Albula glossodonta]
MISCVSDVRVCHFLCVWQMFLTVYLSNNDQHFTEVPVTPETLCRDVLELCKEPGETDCYLAEMWRGSERAMGEAERMLDVLQRWGQQRAERDVFAPAGHRCWHAMGLRSCSWHSMPLPRFANLHQGQCHSVKPCGMSAQRGQNVHEGGSRGQDHMTKRNGVKTPTDRRMENGVAPPRMDMTLTELQEMAARQQQQIEAQQQLLASKGHRETPPEEKGMAHIYRMFIVEADQQQGCAASMRPEQRLRYLKQQDQRQQQQATEQEKLRRLRENAESQEARLRKVRALKGQVEQKRLSNGKLVEEIEQMSGLFQQKQRELVLAVSKVEELSRQLEMLKNGKMEALHDSQSSAAELDHLYKELQLRNRLNQEQNAKLQQQRDSLNKRNLEVADMDRRVSELRERLWKKKAALQQKENLPNGIPVKDKASKGNQHKPAGDGPLPLQTGPSRVAAVGPYIQSSTVPRGSAGRDALVKPAYPDGTATLPVQESPLKAQSRARAHTGGGLKAAMLSERGNSVPESNGGHGPASAHINTHGSAHGNPQTGLIQIHLTISNTHDDTEVLKRDKDKRVRPFSMFEPSEPVIPSLRKNQSSEDLVRDAQNAGKGPVKVPPPVPSKPKQVNLPLGTTPGQPAYGKPTVSSGTFPGKAKSLNQQQPPTASWGGPAPPSQSHTLPLPPKQDAPPLAATVRPFTPELPSSKEAGPQGFHPPPTAAASSIYSMYTQQPSLGKGYQTVQGALNRAQNRNSSFISMYGKPVIQQPQGTPYPENPYSERADSEVDQGGVVPPAEPDRTPRPLSPTKLLPFISNPYRRQSDVELEALRKKLYHAPRPLKKRSSITEPEGPAGPNIQKLLYQKTTLAAMETTTTSTGSAPFYQPRPTEEEDMGGASRNAEGAPSQSVQNEAPPPSQADAPSEPSGPVLKPEPAAPPSIPETDDLEDFVPPPPPSHPAPTSPGDALNLPLPPPPTPPTASEGAELESETLLPLPPPSDAFLEEFPPYPPPPYPSLGEQPISMQVPEGKRTNLRKVGSERIDHSMRVKFNPLALLLDSSLEGEFDLVQRIIYEVEDPSLPNDEGITALHNAVCAGHTEIVKFLVQFGVNVNAADSDGWTPLHCAASCNNVQVCKFLVESGAAVFATTYSDMQTAADKCEEMEEGYTQCSQFLYGVQEKMGIMNRGVVYSLWDYERENEDELAFKEGDCMTILRREDEDEVEWWWARMGDTEGYIPRNLLGLYPRIKPRQRSLA